METAPYPFIDFAFATAGSLPASARREQPLIGLSVNVDGETSRLHEAYVRSILDAGGVPILIPATTDADALREVVERIDGLLLTGGSDIDGRYFNQPTLEGLTDVNPLRDSYDFLLLRLAADRCLPIFGICRGVQVINVAFGGTIWQDVPSQLPATPLNHTILTDKEKPSHMVALAEGSMLARIFGTLQIDVNSRHHQAVKDLAPEFQATATAPDGVIEAIEGFPARRIWGVQWHPENMADAGRDEGMRALFRHFVGQATLFGQARAIHSRHLTVDSHCDTPMLFASLSDDFTHNNPAAAEQVSQTAALLDGRAIDLARRDRVARVDLAKMAEGRLDGVFVVAYLPQGPRDESSCAAATAQAFSILDDLKRLVAQADEYAGLARTFAQAERLKAQGRRAIFPAVENGYAIGRDLGNLKRLRDAGVVYMTLCHNGANDLCDSAAGDPEHGGLSELGRQTVHEMNRLGMVIDLSHASQTTFYDVLRESRRPVICSHSSCRALCDHPRNLTDDQIRAIAAHDGVVQVCLYRGFLVRGRMATVMDAVDHIEHVIRVAGIGHVGIGSDFDGGGGIEGCAGANELINITVELLRRGYPEDAIAKIWGGNLRRVVDASQKDALQ